MFSIIAPLDTNRLEQFKRTKEVYDTMPYVKEFIIPTRNELKVARYLDDNNLMRDVRIIPYEHKIGFNPSMALNIGVRNATYNNIIITSPEVRPLTNVLEQLSEYIGQNILCEVVDESEDGNVQTVLVSSGYRSEDPSMYFLAMFNKADIEHINGWDEDFMKGYAYEDNDFGARFMRAGLKFKMIDDIKAIHQYHPRSETIKGGSAINQQHFYDNTDNNVIRPKNGLVKE